MFKEVLAFVAKMRRYLFNSGWIMLEKILSLGITFLVTLLVARYLGPSQFGLLAYAMSLTALFGVAGHAGLSGLVMRELVRNPDKIHEVLGTSLVMKAIGYLVGIALVLIFTFSTEELGSDGFYILIILSFTMLLKPFDVIDFWFTSQLKSKFNTYAKVSAMLIVAGLKVLFVFMGAHILYFALANTLQVVLASVLLIVLYQHKSKLSLFSWQASRKRAQQLFSEGWMVFLGSIFAIIYLKTDQVMLKWLVGTEEVGIYAVAAILSEAWYFVPVAIVTSFFPKLINMQKQNDPRYGRSMQQLYDVLFLIAVSIAILVTLFAGPIISSLFGSDYAGSADILIIHIWAGLFIFMRAAFSKWILIEKLVVFSLVTQGLGAFVNVGLNLYLIPRFGGEGAAYATIISYAVASYFSLCVHQKTRPAFFMMSKAMVSPIRLLLNMAK
jgi:O-antigen/teichoic acid export membrane protein